MASEPLHLDKQSLQKDFAGIIGVSEAAVSDMIARGVIAQGDTLGGWLLSYCAHIREQAAGRMALGDLDLATERARLAKEQADKIAYQNAMTRGELVPVAYLEEVLAKTSSRIAGIFDAIPVKLKRRAPHLTHDDITFIDAEIRTVRNEVASMKLAKLFEQDEAEQPGDDGEVLDVIPV